MDLDEQTLMKISGNPDDMSAVFSRGEPLPSTTEGTEVAEVQFHPIITRSTFSLPAIIIVVCRLQGGSKVTTTH